MRLISEKMLLGKRVGIEYRKTQSTERAKEPGAKQNDRKTKRIEKD